MMLTPVLRSLNVFLALIFLTLSTAAWADARYVIDELSVNMRKGMGTDFAINAILKSGDRVTVLSDNDSGYSKVRTADGKVGYILSRFLSKEATGRIRAERMQSKLEDLQAKNSQLTEALAAARSGREQSESESSELQQQRDKLQARLDWIEETSANSVQIAEENQQLRQQLLAMESEVSTLRQDNKEIRTWHKGQKVGAIILGIGLFLGWLLGRLRRPNSAWNSTGL